VFLISIKPLYAYQIFRGTKKFELRRNVAGDIPSGSILVVYASGNVRAIIGEFKVGRVISGGARELKKKLAGERTGLREDAWHYVKGASKAMALEVLEPRLYPRKVTLEEVRRIIPGWSPPLSYKRLLEGDPLYELIVKKLRQLVVDQA